MDGVILGGRALHVALSEKNPVRWKDKLPESKPNDTSTSQPAQTPSTEQTKVFEEQKKHRGFARF